MASPSRTGYLGIPLNTNRSVVPFRGMSQNPPPKSFLNSITSFFNRTVSLPSDILSQSSNNDSQEFDDFMRNDNPIENSFDATIQSVEPKEILSDVSRVSEAVLTPAQRFTQRLAGRKFDIGSPEAYERYRREQKKLGNLRAGSKNK